MSAYDLCPRCTVVPVSKPGDLCEACQRRADQDDVENVGILRRLTRKPRETQDAFNGGRTTRGSRMKP